MNYNENERAAQVAEAANSYDLMPLLEAVFWDSCPETLRRNLTACYFALTRHDRRAGTADRQAALDTLADVIEAIESTEETDEPILTVTDYNAKDIKNLMTDLRAACVELAKWKRSAGMWSELYRDLFRQCARNLPPELMSEHNQYKASITDCP